jgi:hypothetical protein
MNFIPNTQEELRNLDIQEGNQYKIEYQNKDYFNGETTIENSLAQCINNDGLLMFIVQDPYGMDKFISNVRIITE